MSDVERPSIDKLSMKQSPHGHVFNSHTGHGRVTGKTTLHSWEPEYLSTRIKYCGELIIIENRVYIDQFFPKLFSSLLPSASSASSASSAFVQVLSRYKYINSFHSLHLSFTSLTLSNRIKLQSVTMKFTIVALLGAMTPLALGAAIEARVPEDTTSMLVFHNEKGEVVGQRVCL